MLCDTLYATPCPHFWLLSVPLHLHSSAGLLQHPCQARYHSLCSKLRTCQQHKHMPKCEGLKIERCHLMCSSFEAMHSQQMTSRPEHQISTIDSALKQQAPTKAVQQLVSNTAVQGWLLDDTQLQQTGNAEQRGDTVSVDTAVKAKICGESSRLKRYP